MIEAVMVALAVILLGIVAASLIIPLRRVGRATDPSPELPVIHPKDRRRQFAQHDEWDTAYRRALPPTPGAPVWERRPYRKETP